ncbi:MULTISPECIES: biopolymer transporter ExbD [Trichocoleus]|uniref:Biopolymer transporter ExbD n=1 Tax=Trichocoleus desertorum GB2-A4 TaxID=2933944 RepID=A0ABV0JDJ6_9CYAN|nr:biopolymer transporter ExbD [Trichocoleus sp. FACHB-46]MBD1861259.1 biopolymer transporter ExbD [Trichocoleus sp. FACHB-46]
MRLPSEPDVPPQINIVPMIDVIFAILTFFILSSLYLTSSQGLPVNLPKAATAQAQSSTRITITIDPQGQIALNRQAIPLDALEVGVRNLIPSGQESIVVLNADENVRHGQVVQVMDRLRRVPGARLAIATQRP